MALYLFYFLDANIKIFIKDIGLGVNAWTVGNMFRVQIPPRRY